MDSIMETFTRRPRERAPSVPGGFPGYTEEPSRQRSRSRPAPVSDTETTYDSSSVLSVEPPKPPKGILKNSPSRLQEKRLAARFYRVPPPVQTHQAPRHSPARSPTYYASDSTYTDHDCETDVNSTSSELSVNTQATSVASSDFSDVRPRKPSVQTRHVRPVSLPTTITRVRARPRTRTSSEVSRSEVTKGPSQSSGRRTVHIQIIPNKTTPSDAQNMQLARVPGRELVHKLERLESDTEDLRHHGMQLSRKLDYTSDELSIKMLENKQMVRELYQERNAKELIIRDLEEQRKLFDEFRCDFVSQKSALMEAERERDRLRQAHSDAEKKLLNIERDISEREQQQKEQDELLQQQIAKLAAATTTLEEKVTISDEKLKTLAAERDNLQAVSRQYQVQLNVLREINKTDRNEPKATEELQKQLQFNLDRYSTEKQGLEEKITHLEENVFAFRAHITESDMAMKNLEDTLAIERATTRNLEKTSAADRDALLQQLSAEKDTTEKQLLADNDRVQKQLSAEKAELETRLEATTDELARQLQSTKAALETQLMDTKGELEKQLEDAKVALETQLEAHKAEREELEQKIEAGEAAKINIENELWAAKDALVTEVKEARYTLQTKGSTWQTEKDDKQTTIDGLITELAGAKNANISLAMERLVMENKLKEVEAGLASIQAELADLRATHETLMSDNEQLKTQNGDLTQKAADLDQLHIEKVAEIEKLQAEHATLDERIQTIQADLDTAHAARDIIMGEKEKMEVQVKELEAGSPALMRLKGEKVELEAQVSSLQADADKAATLTQANADLEARASTLQEKADQVPTLEQSNTELSQAKTDLEGRIAVVQGEASLIPGLRDQIEQLNGQIRNMQNAASATANSNSASRKERPLSRSNSRAPGKRHGRSPSNGLVFVRSPSEKGGVYITTREALAKEKERGD
ncbi:hypothetical protein F4808DRAFT_107911 [Astrocystis sublimbata]|nr:hypothetical protein F4808DRAFT_107911 [Astrocystis sublimbata]